MIIFSPTWDQAVVAAASVAALSAGLTYRGQALARAGGETAAPRARRLVSAGRFARETALVLALFALWQFAGSHAVMGPGGAVGRARWLWHAERVMHWPSEAWLQHLILPYPYLVQAFNLYYDILHFPVLIACLVWLFVWHRERYGSFRITLVAFTGICLLIQFVPVAPPRMLSGIGMVDTAARYGQSVYSSTAAFQADELSAMPSVHVGWAILVAIAVITVSSSRWRWLALLYPVLTSVAVVVTANHFWLDGVVAGVVLAAVLAVQAAARRLLAARVSRTVPQELVSQTDDAVTRSGGG
ncbi:MAG TPA: phosphatase PAP2 family protein [Streptosporangiaceae bacterium]|nr:phosphatase PAP2 family protein [Streptosporangiaceae bacterium]